MCLDEILLMNIRSETVVRADSHVGSTSTEMQIASITVLNVIQENSPTFYCMKTTISQKLRSEVFDLNISDFHES